MIVCPVCEHQQAQGAECEVCGKSFGKVAAPAVPVAPMAELEGTRIQAAAAAVAAPVIAMPELEVTKLQSGPDLPVTPVPELDRARANALNVPVERMADMDLGREPENPAERTAAPTGPVTCRYCRNVQVDGLVCDRCGMRLPRYVPSANAAVAASTSASGEAPTIMHACGARTQVGARCTSCGVFVPLLDQA